jgi:hypothetical protein
VTGPTEKNASKILPLKNYIGIRFPSLSVSAINLVLARYRSHPEPKSFGPDGAPCNLRTSGALQRGPVAATTVTYNG